VVTEELATEVEKKLRDLYTKGETDFGSERLAEVIAIGQAPEQPPEDDDPRSLREMIWWRDVLGLMVDEAMPPVDEFFGRVGALLAEHNVQSPEQLPQEIFVPLEAEAHQALRIRQAAEPFGFQLA
jgi:hypothetical protein